MLTSTLLLVVHAGLAFSMAILYRRKPSAPFLALLIFYFVMVCYWAYYPNSGGA